MDIGGVDGLVHVTDLSWGRVQHPSDVVKVGDEIDVKILNVDPARERISLSYKATRPRPWTVAGEKYPVGSIVEGKVVRITTFGAFVELEPAWTAWCTFPSALLPVSPRSKTLSTSAISCA